jgi:hypothetical protein
VSSARDHGSDQRAFAQANEGDSIGVELFSAPDVPDSVANIIRTICSRGRSKVPGGLADAAVVHSENSHALPPVRVRELAKDPIVPFSRLVAVTVLRARSGDRHDDRHEACSLNRNRQRARQHVACCTRDSDFFRRIGCSGGRGVISLETRGSAGLCRDDMRCHAYQHEDEHHDPWLRQTETPIEVGESDSPLRAAVPHFSFARMLDISWRLRSLNIFRKSFGALVRASYLALHAVISNMIGSRSLPFCVRL